MAFEGLVTFAIANKIPLLFYLVVIIVIYAFKHKIDWQGPAIGLYKTKFGIKLMKKLSSEYTEFFRWLGYLGIGVGFSGMMFIVWMLIKGMWELVFNPSAPAVIAPVIPGFNIPGVGITVPLITGWLTLFVVVVVHEFSHGVVSKAHGIPVKSSGLLVFGPILGAFVEPDEKKLLKSSDVVQYSMYAAGPFSNILSGLFFTLLSAIIIIPLIGLLTTASGIGIASITPESSAELAGLESGTIIVEAGGILIADSIDFFKALETIREGDTLTMVDNKGTQYDLIVGPGADERSNKGRIGVTLQNERAAINDSALLGYGLIVLNWIGNFFKWIIILNFGIGLANLLPLGPVDGGRMVQTLFLKLFGKTKGTIRFKLVTKITLVVLLVLLFVPIIKSFF